MLMKEEVEKRPVLVPSTSSYISLMPTLTMTDKKRKKKIAEAPLATSKASKAANYGSVPFLRIR